MKYELKPFNIKIKIVAPGGVVTDFATRSLKMTMDGESAYDALLQNVLKAFGDNASVYSTADQIAEVIYGAATDGTDHLRYLAGQDAEQLYASWQRMSNEAFFTMVNTKYGLGE